MLLLPTLTTSFKTGTSEEEKQLWPFSKSLITTPLRQVSRFYAAALTPSAPGPPDH